MCGIVGALCFGDLSPEKEKQRQEMMRIITTELMLETEPRGEDATGAAILFNDGRYFGVKRGEKVSRFFATYPITADTVKDCYLSLLDVWRSHETKAPVRAYLGHCRKGTVGEKENNNNNHPIKIRNLVGIHNGVIKNDYKIFRKLGCKRDGRVDTEAIFRLFNHFTNEGKEPFTMDMIQQVYNRLEGFMTIMLFNADNPWQVPLFRDGRPAELVFVKELGLLFVFSEYKFWGVAHSAYERVIHYYQGKAGRLPTLLEGGGLTIERKVLPDDSAILFDLTIQCTSETKIEDLGEYKKLSRTDKIWQNASTTTTTTANKGTGAAATTAGTAAKNTTTSTATADKKADEDKKKYRVFDPITRTYKVQIGDKVIGDDQGAVVKAEESKDNKNDVVVVTDNETLTKDVKDEDDTIIESGKVEETKASAVDINDKTDYTSKDNDVDDATDEVDEVIDVDYEELSTDELTTVDMVPIPPEVLAEGENAFKSLSNDEKGFDNWDDAITQLELKDEAAVVLGNHFVCNRIFRYAWIKGYIAAKLDGLSSTADDNKDDRREKHIKRLKSLVMVLVSYFLKNRQLSKDNAERSLRDAVINYNGVVDTAALSAVFNTYEQERLKTATSIIEDASKYRA